MARPIPQKRKWSLRRARYRSSTETVKNTMITVERKGRTNCTVIENASSFSYQLSVISYQFAGIGCQTVAGDAPPPRQGQARRLVGRGEQVRAIQPRRTARA